MIVLYVILGIILFLFLLTLLNIHITAIYHNELRLWVRIAFVKLQLVPPKPKKKKKKKKKTQKSPKKQPKKKPEEEPKKKSFDFKAFVKEKGVSGIINIVKEIAKLAGGTVSDVLSAFTVTRLKLDIKVAGSDAADSAIKYGRVCAALFPSLQLIMTVVKVKKYDVNVNPDFSDEPKNSADAEVFAKIRIISILRIGIKRGLQALKLFIKAKPKKDTKENKK